MRNRTLTRATQAVAASTLAATLLTGCAWKSSPMVDSAPAKSLTAATFPTAIADAIKGIRTVHMEIAQSASTTVVDFDGSGSTFRARTTTTTPATSRKPGRTIEFVFVGNYVYGRAKPTDKWVKAPLDPNSNTKEQFDPAAMLALFSKSTKTFTDAGTASIDGAEFHQYDVTLDASALSGSATSLGSSAVVQESFYLGDDNMPRRIVLSLPGGVGDTQIDFTNWGKVPDITAPPASQIAPAKTNKK